MNFFYRSFVRIVRNGNNFIFHDIFLPKLASNVNEIIKIDFINSSWPLKLAFAGEHKNREKESKRKRKKNWKNLVSIELSMGVWPTIAIVGYIMNKLFKLIISILLVQWCKIFWSFGEQTMYAHKMCNIVIIIMSVLVWHCKWHS